jgi:ribosomal protein S2
MSNIFNDLNKMVNTIQKVDKLLSEKPKRTRTKSISLTQKEINYLVEHLGGLKNFELDPDDIPSCRSVYNKVKKLV